MRKDYRGREYLNETDAESISELLIGRRVVEAHNGILMLDDGTVLEVEPNRGCGGCSSGNYYLEHLETVNNAITAVELSDKYDGERFERTYRIYVYANGMRHDLLRVVGDDGNGYYGTGYELYVRVRGKGDGE